jgi:hypothetical protein
MSCELVKKLADDYIFGLLTDEEAASVKEHISSCESCGKVIGQAQAFRSSLSSWTVIEPRKGFAEAVALSAWRQNYAPFIRVCQAIAIAASILAAVIIYSHHFAVSPAPQPLVQPSIPHITTRTGVLQDVGQIDVEFPSNAEADSACVFLRFFPQEHRPLSIRVEVNGRLVGDFYRSPASAGQVRLPYVYLISRHSGIQIGKNRVSLKNLTGSTVRYELVSCCDIISTR